VPSTTKKQRGTKPGSQKNNCEPLYWKNLGKGDQTFIRIVFCREGGREQVSISHNNYARRELKERRIEKGEVTVSREWPVTGQIVGRGGQKKRQANCKRKKRKN